MPPTFALMNSAIALVLLVRERYTISIFLSEGTELLFGETCCAFEQPHERQMIVTIISDKAVLLFIVKKTSIELLLSQQSGKRERHYFPGTALLHIYFGHHEGISNLIAADDCNQANFV